MILAAVKWRMHSCVPRRHSCRRSAALSRPRFRTSRVSKRFGLFSSLTPACRALLLSTQGLCSVVRNGDRHVQACCGASRLCTADRCLRIVRTYCLIGGLAVNCYVEPVYTLDADLVVIAGRLPELTAYLEAHGFKTEIHKYSVNALAPGSELRIQFTPDERHDERYQAFPARSVDANVLGIRVKVACREDVTQGKLWAYSDPHPRLSKRNKDELDLTRLAEAYPELKSLYPSELCEQLDRG